MRTLPVVFAALPLAIAVVGLCVFALVLQVIYERAESIVAPWLIHVCGVGAMVGIGVARVGGGPVAW